MQVVDLFNGPLVRQKLADGQNRFRRSIAQGRQTDDIVEELYRIAVCRKPTDAELNSALAHVAASDNSANGLEDVYWVLLNSDEFLTQH